MRSSVRENSVNHQSRNSISKLIKNSHSTSNSKSKIQFSNNYSNTQSFNNQGTPDHKSKKLQLNLNLKNNTLSSYKSPKQDIKFKELLKDGEDNHRKTDDMKL